MENTKLIALLKTLDDKTIKRFADFVQSPFFNKNKTIIRFCEVVLSFYPEFEPAKINREKLFKKIYPDKAFHSGTWHNLISDVMALFESFLQQINLELLPVDAELYLVNQLIYRKDYKTAEKKLLQLHQNLTTEHQPDAHTYYNQLKINIGLCQIYLATSAFEKYSKIVQNNLQTVALLNWNLSMETKMQALNLLQVARHTPIDLTVLNQIITTFNPNEATTNNNPNLLAYYYGIAMMEQPNWQNYGLLKQTYELYKSVFTWNIKLNINTLLSNYLKQMQFKQPLTPVLHEELFKLYLEAYPDMVAMQGHIPANLFDNIVLEGQKLRSKNWVLEFIAENIKYWPNPATQQAYQLFAQGRLLLAQGELHEAIALLANAEPFIENGYFDTKLLLMYAYFETNNDDAFELTLDAYKNTAKNHPELAEHHAKYIPNMLWLLPKLLKLKNQYSNKRYQQLQTFIETDTTYLHSKTWALKQLTQIEHAINAAQGAKKRRWA